MIRFNKFFERISRLFNIMISDNYKLNHKYQNKIKLQILKLY